MRRYFPSKLLSLFLLSCLFLNGCGDRPAASPDSGSQTNIPGSGSSQTESDILDETTDNVITIGALSSYYDEVNLTALPFNIDQSQYQVTVKKYNRYENLITDILRGQGADIYCLKDLPVEVLTQKGILEDLTPYFASSDMVHQEDIFSSIWNAGTFDGKMTCVIPSFVLEGIIVEKGHTDDGGWTIADYLALAEEYPDGKICEDIADPANLFTNDLVLAPELYIDWEAGTCSFDSGDFIELLEKLKEYSLKKYNLSSSGTPAERLHKREWLTLRALIMPVGHMTDYLLLKNAMGDEFELAGFPGMDGEPRYRINNYTHSAYGMNAFSEKKEGAWAFLEYLLSEPVQTKYAQLEFPARQDVLDSVLQDAMDLDPTVYHSGYSNYTLEMERLTSPFTEEDRQNLLKMLNHVERFSVMDSGQISTLIREELHAYFNGDKTATDTAAIIQNRVQLYLDEMK